MSAKTLDAIRSRLSRIDGAREEIEGQIDGLDDRANAAAERAEELDQTLAVLRGLEQDYREQFQRNLSDIVSHAVSVVFGEDIKVRLDTKTFRDTTSMEIVVEQDDMETDIMSAKGGSFVQVCAFALRVLMVRAAGVPLMPFILLDEPFAMVSAEYRPRVAELIRELRKQLGMQFLIITHEPELLDAADVAYEVDKQDGKSATIRPLKAHGEEQA